ncbi:MAG TPA: hypothetical protein PLD47_14610 [Aggregatilineales bacterium]|nr:hypothetical protein [Anaerolineales bacterium]HRE48956.1 hypothetical protein [Aggregatilineales bacterium]
MSYRRTSRRRSTRRNQRQVRERSFESAIYGMIAILFIVDIMYPQLNPAWVSVIGGAILLGSGIYQTNQRWRVSIFTWLGGFLLLIVGVLALQTGQMPLGTIFPVLVLIGVVVLAVVNGDL